MVIGVPKEKHRHEHRVGLTPFAVAKLTHCGHSVYIERGAGQAAHFTDEAFVDTGAQIVYDATEVYGRSDLVCRFGALSPDELNYVKLGSTICGFHHLAVASREMVETLMKRKSTLIGYEIVQDREGELAALWPMSELAGQMAVDVAAQLLRYESGGRGIILGTATGLPPATVVILGAGAVGSSAARFALERGAHVLLIDNDLKKLHRVNWEFGGRVVTALGGNTRLERYTAIADVLIGAILIPGGRSPLLVTEKMVKAMKPGSVIIDVSIDQGGCVETSRPTTLDDPTFRVHNVVHYCVPNMTADIPRTASRAMANGALPFIIEMAEKGTRQALKDNEGLGRGVYIYEGTMVNQMAGETLGIPAVPLSDLL